MNEFVTGEDKDKIQAHLTEDEKLLWCGKPVVSPLNAGVLLTAIFGITWTALAVFILTQIMASDTQDSPATMAIISLFILAGVFLIVFLPLYTYRRATNWLYGLTNRRAILIQHNKLYEYPLKPYMVLRARTPEGKNGSIVFELRREGGKSNQKVEYGFLNTPEAAVAMRLLRELLDGKATNDDKPAKLREQEKREKQMAQARYFYPYLVAVAALATFEGTLIAKMAGWIRCEWLKDDTFGLANLSFFVFIFLIGLSISLHASWRGRRYMQQQ